MSLPVLKGRANNRVPLCGTRHRQEMGGPARDSGSAYNTSPRG